MNLVTIGALTLLTAAAFVVSKQHRVLLWIAISYAFAWAIVANKAPDLWVIALLGFIQNIAFTFVSRGRNSGSLGYHLIAAIFSNGLYATLLFVSIDQVAQAKNNPGLFLAVYTLATMSGSIFAHWLALRLEKGKAKTMTEDKHAALMRRVSVLEASLGRPVSERLHEMPMPDGRFVRAWIDTDEDAEKNRGAQLRGLIADPTNPDVDSAELARIFCERLEANAVQISVGGKGGYVYYRSWP